VTFQQPPRTSAIQSREPHHSSCSSSSPSRLPAHTWGEGSGRERKGLL
jgi:hypothetical protein